MRRLGLLPIAVLGAGCGLRPWTPSVSVAFWAEDVPGERAYVVPSSADLARAWQLPPESPWSRYYKGTLVSAATPMKGSATLPDVRRLEVRRCSRRRYFADTAASSS